MATDGTNPAPRPDALAEIREVVGRAKRGDAAAVPRLKELLDRHPDIWERYGDLATQVEKSWVELAAGDNLHLKESVTRYAAKLRAELTRPSASAIEKLLVERAVATWVQLNYFSGVEVNTIAGDASPRMLQLRARRHAQAQRQHERALSALVAYQRLHPAARVREALPIAGPVAAEAAAAADLGRPLALREVAAAAEVESFASIPGFRPAERLRVGVAG